MLDELETLAPVVAVQGNIEYEEVVAKLPIKREVVVGHCCIGIVHILGEASTRVRLARLEFPNAHCVVYGYSHIPSLLSSPLMVVCWQLVPRVLVQSIPRVLKGAVGIGSKGG